MNHLVHWERWTIAGHDGKHTNLNSPKAKVVGVVVVVGDVSVRPAWSTVRLFPGQNRTEQSIVDRRYKSELCSVKVAGHQKFDAVWVLWYNSHEI